MQLKLAKSILELLYDVGYSDEVDVEIYENYRHTHDKTTTAITGIDLSKLISIIIEHPQYFIDCDGNSIFSNVENFQQDRLGLKTIIY